METTSTSDLAKGERVFLHDIANHLVVAQGMTGFVHRALKENRPIDAKDIDRLERAMEAIKRIATALKERRELLHTLSE